METMKNFYKTALAAIAAITISSACYAVDVKVKITGIKDHTGNVMVAANISNPEKLRAEMTPVSGKTAEVVLKNMDEGPVAIYVFVDANGNFNLDLNEMSIPIEGCAIKQVNVSEGMGVVEIPLEYHAEKKK